MGSLEAFKIIDFNSTIIIIVIIIIVIIIIMVALIYFIVKNLVFLSELLTAILYN